MIRTPILLFSSLLLYNDYVLKYIDLDVVFLRLFERKDLEKSERYCSLLEHIDRWSRGPHAVDV